MYVCMYVFILYVCIMHACMYVCMHACMHVCIMYVCVMHVCMHACMYYVCMCVFIITDPYYFLLAWPGFFRFCSLILEYRWYDDQLACPRARLISGNIKW